MGSVVEFEQSRQSTERSLAINIDLEQEVLAAILANPATLAQVQSILKPEYFSEQLHQMIYAAIVEIIAADGLPTGGQLYQRLRPKISEHQVNGGEDVRQYMIRLMIVGGMPGAALITHARMIRDLHFLRCVVAVGAGISQRFGYDPRAYLDECFESFDEIRALRHDRSLKSVTLAAAGRDMMSQIEADLKGERPDPAKTGIDRLDKEIGGGLRPATLTTLGGRTGMGKSITGLALILSAASQGFGCIYHSLEMSKEQVMARLTSSWLERRGLRIPFAQILERGGLSQTQAEQVAQAVHDMKDLNIIIEDGGGRTILEIAASSERSMKGFARKGIALGPIAIDHAHLVRPSRAFNREDEGLKEVADGSLTLAKHLDVPVLLLAQCNRKTEGRDDKRPSLADLRGSGAFEENSDIVLFLYRPAYYIESSAAFRNGDLSAQEQYDAAKNILEIIIDKNRAGRSNQVVKAWIDPALNAIRNRLGGRT